MEQIQHEFKHWKNEIELIQEHAKTMSRDVWLKNFGESYHQAIDTLFIKCHVCEAVYRNDKRCQPKPKFWDEKVDGRGEEFFAELSNEIHDIIGHEVAVVIKKRQETSDKSDH
jgi:hypothetical protein